MIIVAGWLRVDASRRADYLDAVAGVAPAARRAPGCLEFVQAADPVEPDRIVVFERWTDDASLLAFRDTPGPDDGAELPPVLDAEVAKYRIAAVESP